MMKDLAKEHTRSCFSEVAQRGPPSQVIVGIFLENVVGSAEMTSMVAI